MGRRMRFHVEPSPAGGYHVKVEGSPVPVSRHDTEREAETRRDAYAGATAARATERLRLRDDSLVIVRPLKPDEGPLVQAVFDGMGEERRYQRFLGYKKRLSARDLEMLTAVDHHGHEALVALEAETGEALGVARMLRDPNRPDTAEASVSVVDAYQGRGLGGMLLERLVQRAREEGVRRFTAVLLTRNRTMLHLFERAGAVRVTSRYGDTLELEVELPLETGAPGRALRAAAAGEVHGQQPAGTALAPVNRGEHTGPSRQRTAGAHGSHAHRPARRGLRGVVALTDQPRQTCPDLADS